MRKEEDVGGGVDINAVVSNDNCQEQHIDDGESDEALQKNKVTFSIKENKQKMLRSCDKLRSSTLINTR